MSERKLQRTFGEIHLAALAAQGKAEDDFLGVRKLSIQMQKTSYLRRIKYMSHGSNKNEAKVTSSDKSKVFKFKRESNQSKHLQKTQKGRPLFVFGSVKTKNWWVLRSQMFPVKRKKRNHLLNLTISRQKRL